MDKRPPKGFGLDTPTTIPVFNAECSASPARGRPPLNVTLTSRGVPDLGFSYQWSLGDGGTATSATVIHSYDRVGTFTATVTVSNGDTRRTCAVEITTTPDGE